MAFAHSVESVDRSRQVWTVVSHICMYQEGSPQIYLRSTQPGYDELPEERFKRKFERTCSILERLSQATTDFRRKLRGLQHTSAKFKSSRAHCRNRHFSRQLKYLKQYIYLVLDFESLNTRMKPGGELELALSEAKKFLAVSWTWSSRGVEPGDLTRYSQDSIVPDIVDYEYLQAQSHLEQLFAYEHVLELGHQTVESQLSQLESVEDTLDEEERQKKMEQQQYETSMERLARLVRQATIRLQVNLEFLLLLCKSSKFPDGDEPACTTMPWNILPALIVLWGVCWMFYGSSGFSDPTAVQYPGRNDEVPDLGEFRH